MLRRGTSALARLWLVQCRCSLLSAAAASQSASLRAFTHPLDRHRYFIVTNPKFYWLILGGTVCLFHYQYIPVRFDGLGLIFNVSKAFWLAMVSPNVQHTCREHGALRDVATVSDHSSHIQPSHIFPSPYPSPTSPPDFVKHP